MTTAPPRVRAEFQRLGVVGAGAWGTALACVAARAGRAVLLWAHEPEIAAEIREHRRNTPYLADVTLDADLEVTTRFSDLDACTALLFVVPAQFFRQVSRSVFELLAPRPAVLCAKGIEHDTLQLMTEVAGETLPGWDLAVLSGPSFAADVARGLPTAVTLAAQDLGLAEDLANAIAIPSFRPYVSADPIGAEIGGAVKNVLAIATGIVAGRRLGESAKAALIARGFAELTRFGVARGADPRTVAGLSGLGDLILTCSSAQSRNMSLGMALGEGRRLGEILSGRRAVTEGVATAPALVALAHKAGIAMPISQAVAAILDGKISVDEAIENLLSRPLGPETR